MYKPGEILNDFSTTSTSPPENFKLGKALIVAKLSRYEFERLRHPNWSSSELEKQIRNRGSDYDSLIYYNALNNDFRNRVVDSFKEFGVQVKVVDRLSITKDIIKWADAIVPIGGDGTFLLAASRASSIYPNSKKKIPVFGFNSDPKGSEGRLMLPKQYSSDIKSAIRQILQNDFKWMHRSRIRTTVLDTNGNLPEAVDLHEQKGGPMEQVCLEPKMLSATEQKLYGAKVKRTLPYLALNEVFIGETLSSRVSHLQLEVDNQITNTKCSGLCVSTGTGSTSWHTSINRLSKKNVQELLEIIKLKNINLDNVDAHTLAEEFNRRLVFAPDDPRICYSIREEIYVGVWPNPKNLESRAFVNKLYVKSRCLDASLVIDGSISYPFNDGAKVLLEVYPEDALLTISMD